MNRARRTARRRRVLLSKGISSDPKSLLGKWARKIYLQGRPLLAKLLASTTP